MKPNGQRVSFRILGASERGAGWIALTERVALASLVALSLLAWSAVVAPGHARAAGSPRLVFVAPVYPGQNNGFAEGPVGTAVTVKGSGWTPPDNTPNSQPVVVSLADEQQDTPGRPGSACQNGAPHIILPLVDSGGPPDSNGSITVYFQWPLEAGTKGHSYWACGKQGNTTSVGVSKFTVISANPPTVVINVSQAVRGSNITVTGHNWLPGGVQVEVLIAPCVGCDPPFYTKAQVTSRPDGSISTSVQVPPDAPLGTTLYVTARSIDPNNLSAGNSGALGAGYTVPITFTVVAQVAATATPTAASTPAAVDTAHAGSAGGNNSNTNSSASNTVLMVLLASSNALLFIVVIVLILLYLRLRSQAPGAPGGDSSRSGGTGGHALPGARYSGPPAYPDTSANEDALHSLSGPQGQEWGC